MGNNSTIVNSEQNKEAKTEELLLTCHEDTSTDHIESYPHNVINQKLLAWCSWRNNKISIADLKTKQPFLNFNRVPLHHSSCGFLVFFYLDTNDKTADSWTHVKEVPNSSLLISLHNNCDESANMEIFDISEKGHAKKVYAFEEALGGNMTAV